jgi:hypothetical protein
MSDTTKTSLPQKPRPRELSARPPEVGYHGLDQGPIVMMIENYRSGLIWRLMLRCPYIIEGLRRAGFTGGWLGRGK